MEKVKRKISRTHVIAFIISSLLFFVGILMGLQFSYYGMSEVDKGFEELKNDEYIMEILMLTDESDELSCGFYDHQLAKFSFDTWEFGRMLDRAENAKGKLDPEVMQLKSSYSLMQFRDSLLLKQIKTKCNISKIIIYYFYSNGEDYDPRTDQGKVLDMIWGSNPSGVAIYSFDINAKSPVIDLMREKHNITSVPTMIINDEKYEGYMEYDELNEIIKTKL
jgi:hypothetical protein